MNFRSCLLAAAAMFAMLGIARADDQTQIGAVNAIATATASHSRLVMSAYARLRQRLQASITNPVILKGTMDGLFNPDTCVQHRANLTQAQKQAILNQIVAAGLVNPSDGASITGGVYAGIFPALINDKDGANSCPNFPMPWYVAPGSGNGSHHSYPGGLPIHESFNTGSAFTFAGNYRNVYGRNDKDGLPVAGPLGEAGPTDNLTLSEEIVVGTPMWHDWAKPMVFQFTSTGTLFTELAFGGSGTNDNNGAPGDSRTGGHHILGIAETIKRGFPADFIIAQASAHASPTLGNEYKVVNWIRTAAIIDQIDPVAAGLLIKDASGNFRLPPLRRLGALDLLAAGQANVLAEYPLHNLSDADFVFSIPAVNDADIILQAEAHSFGYDPVNRQVAYQTAFRNVALSNLSAERIQITYANQGLGGVKALLNILRAKHAL